MSVRLHRHVAALLSDFAAEHGEIDLVGRRIECSIGTYETLTETFDRFGVVGGAGIRVVRDDEMLLVRYDRADGWVDPGDSRRPGESYTECAKRGVREATGIDAAIDGLAQIHLLCMDDPTDRPPAPNPYLSFVGTTENKTVQPTDGVTARWLTETPEETLYDELAELSLSE